MRTTRRLTVVALSAAVMTFSGAATSWATDDVADPAGIGSSTEREDGDSANPFSEPPFGLDEVRPAATEGGTDTPGDELPVAIDPEPTDESTPPSTGSSESTVALTTAPEGSELPTLDAPIVIVPVAPATDPAQSAPSEVVPIGTDAVEPVTEAQVTGDSPATELDDDNPAPTGGSDTQVTIIATQLPQASGTVAPGAVTGAPGTTEPAVEPEPQAVVKTSGTAIPQLSSTGTPTQKLLPVGLLSLGFGLVILYIARRVDRSSAKH